MFSLSIYIYIYNLLYYIIQFLRKMSKINFPKMLTTTNFLLGTTLGVKDLSNPSTLSCSHTYKKYTSL